MPRRNNRVTVADIATVCQNGERLTWAEYIERQAAQHRAAITFMAAAQKGMSSEEFRAYAHEMGA